MKREKNCCRPHHGRFHGLGFAVMLILAGVLLLCTRLNFIPAKYIDVLISWQMLLIVAGIASLFKRHFIWGLTLIIIGKFFLIPEIAKVPDSILVGVPENFVHLYWPVLLIAAGLLFFLHRITAPSRKFDNMQSKFLYHAEKHGHKNKYECENGYVNKNSVFEGSEHIVLDPEFKGGVVKTVFGETKLDLRKTSLPEGITRLDLDVAFGAVNIYVPADWRVQLNVNCVFGAFEDKRAFKDGESDPNKTLVIYGSIVFGGGELKN